MTAQELFTVSLEVNPLERWDAESTTTALRSFAVWLHLTGISLRKTAAVLEQFGVTRSHQAVWQWVHCTTETAPDPPTAKPSRVVVDEMAVKIGTERHRLYAAIDVETKLLLGAVVFERRGTNSAAVFSSGWPRNTTPPKRRFSSTGSAI